MFVSQQGLWSHTFVQVVFYLIDWFDHIVNRLLFSRPYLSNGRAYGMVVIICLSSSVTNVLWLSGAR